MRLEHVNAEDVFNGVCGVCGFDFLGVGAVACHCARADG
jgi:hypothetical protein